MDSPIDYDRVVADLEARRRSFNASIDAAISAIKAVLAAGYGVSASSDTNGQVELTTSPPGAITPDKLFGKSIVEAAMLCLSVLRKPLTTREIVEALEKASYHHQSRDFGNTVNSILHRRSRVDGDVVKMGKTWALSEWYPNRRKAKPDREDGDQAESHDQSDEALDNDEA